MIVILLLTNIGIVLLLLALVWSKFSALSSELSEIEHRLARGEPKPTVPAKRPPAEDERLTEMRRLLEGKFSALSAELADLKHRLGSRETKPTLLNQRSNQEDARVLEIRRLFEGNRKNSGEKVDVAGTKTRPDLPTSGSPNGSPR
ncbi:MAG: hypothetical protein ACYC8T_37140 [Myxococcaceae bacterium]